MNILDSVIGFFSPERGYKRSMYREALKERGHAYDAGNFDRLNSSWAGGIMSAEFTDRASRDLIRGRARDLERNSDIANSIINAFTRNIVGTGFSLQAKTGKDKLNKEIETLFKEWTKAKNCDVTGQQSFTQLLRMAVRRKKVDGGILFKKCYTAGGVVPFKLQALEVDELSLSWTTPHQKGNKVAGGIEFDQYNRPVGFWISQYSIDGYDVATPIYYDAKDIIFIYSKFRPSQAREISDLAPTLTRIRDVNEFITSVSVKERVSACLSIFVKKAPPLGGFGRGAVQTPNGVNYSQKRLTPGMITELNAGDDISVVDPKSTSSDAATFLKFQQRLISAGQGLSVEATSRDMSQSNYSSARQAGIEDELTYQEDIELIRDRLLVEVYESFIISAVLSGAVNIPDFWQNKEKYLKHEWIKGAKKWIDPQKEANATATALASGQKTFAQVTAEGGRDWREQIDELAMVQEYAEKKGVKLNLGVTTINNTNEKNTGDNDTGDNSEEQLEHDNTDTEQTAE